MKNLIKQISLMSVMFVALTGCFDGGSDSSSEQPVDGKSNFNPADFTVNQLNPLPANGESQMLVQLQNLPGDDAVYVTVTSDDVENGKLSLSPSKTILNPNDGSASLVISAKDLGVSSAPAVTLTVTTSGAKTMEQTTTMEWSN